MHAFMELVFSFFPQLGKKRSLTFCKTFDRLFYCNGTRVTDQESHALVVSVMKNPGYDLVAKKPRWYLRARYRNLKVASWLTTYRIARTFENFHGACVLNLLNASLCVSIQACSRTKAQFLRLERTWNDVLCVLYIFWNKSSI